MPKKIERELTKLNLIDDKTVGERITEVRKLKGLSQLELSTKIGIARTLICDYEIGRSKIYDEMISRIADALDVTPDTLLGFKKRVEQENNMSLRYTRRIKEIEKLPEHKIKNILRTIDDSIKANK